MFLFELEFSFSNFNYLVPAANLALAILINCVPHSILVQQFWPRLLLRAWGLDMKISSSFGVSFEQAAGLSKTASYHQNSRTAATNNDYSSI